MSTFAITQARMQVALARAALDEAHEALEAALAVPDSGVDAVPEEQERLPFEADE